MELRIAHQGMFSTHTYETPEQLAANLRNRVAKWTAAEDRAVQDMWKRALKGETSFQKRLGGKTFRISTQFAA